MNYVTTSPRLPIIKCSLRVTHVAYASACNCVSHVASTHTSRYLEVRGMENREFGLWIAREWPRGSRHMLADEFSGAVVTSGDVRGSSAWFWVGNSIFGMILHNQPSLSSLRNRTWFCRDSTQYVVNFSYLSILHVQEINLHLKLNYIERNGHYRDYSHVINKLIITPEL